MKGTRLLLSIDHLRGIQPTRRTENTFPVWLHLNIAAVYVPPIIISQTSYIRHCILNSVHKLHFFARLFLLFYYTIVRF